MRKIVALFVVLASLTSCNSKQKEASQKEESLKQEYLLKGQEIVNLSQAELLKNVSAAMKSGGPGFAVDFCNIHAIPIKDSLSHLNNCEIRRISSKYRNPRDKPQTKTENDQLIQYQKAHEQGDSLKATVYIFDDRIEYYQAIILNKGACLLCHGDPDTQIAAETFEIIKAHYPEDLATDFALNDFRGSWKITFKKD